MSRTRTTMARSTRSRTMPRRTLVGREMTMTTMMKTMIRLKTDKWAKARCSLNLRARKKTRWRRYREWRSFHRTWRRLRLLTCRDWIMPSRSVPRPSKLYKSLTIRSWPIQIRRTAGKTKTIIRDKTCPSRKWRWIVPPWAIIMSITSQTWRQKKLNRQKTSLQAPSSHNLRIRTKVAVGGPRVASTKVMTITVKIFSIQTRATISNRSIR